MHLVSFSFSTETGRLVSFSAETKISVSVAVSFSAENEKAVSVGHYCVFVVCGWATSFGGTATWSSFLLFHSSVASSEGRLKMPSRTNLL